jgi:hypothetical protein
MQRTVWFFAALTLALVLLGIFGASSLPDGLEHVAETQGFASRAEDSPSWSLFADYKAAFLESPWQSQALAGLLGAGLLYGCGAALSAAFKNKGKD